MTQIPSPLITELKNILPESTWSWIIPSLYEDPVVWESLNTHFEGIGFDHLSEIIQHPKDCSPAAISIRILNYPHPPETLCSLPMAPLDLAFKKVAGEAGGKEVQSIFEAGLQALSLRERRRETGSWEGLIELLYDASPTTLSCLFGMIPDQNDFLKALLIHPREHTAFRDNIHQIIKIIQHIILSNPLSAEKQAETYNLLLRELPAPYRLEILDNLSFRRPSLVSALSHHLITENESTLATLPTFNHQVKILENSYQAAKIQRIEDHTPNEISNLTKSIEMARQIQAHLAAQLALAAQKHQDVEKAISAWKEAVHLDPVTPSFFAGYILNLIEGGQVDEAKEQMDKLLPMQTLPYHPLVMLARIRLNLCLSGNEASPSKLVGDYYDSARQVLDFLKKSINNSRNEPLLDTLSTIFFATHLTSILLELGCFDEAAEAAQIAIKVQADKPHLYLLQAEALHEGGKHSDAVQIAHLMVALEPENLDLRRYLAYSLEAAKAWEAALKERKTIIDRQPNINQADFHAYAASALRAGQPKLAIQTCTKALKQDEKDGLSYALLGEAKHTLSEIDEAFDNLKQSVDLLPNHPYPWLVLARLYQSKCDDLKVLETLRAASQTNMHRPEVYLALAEAYLKEDSPTQALSALRQASGSIPNQRINQLVLKHHPQDEIDQNSHKIEKYISNKKAYQNQDITSPDITNSQLRNRIALKFGQTLDELGHISEARQVLEAAYSVTPTNADLAYAYAKTLIKLKDIETAITPLQSVLDTQPEIPEPYIDYARCRMLLIKNHPRISQENGMHKTEGPSLTKLNANIQAYLDDVTRSLQNALEIQPEHLEARTLLAEAQLASGDYAIAMEAFNSLVNTNLAENPDWKCRIALGLADAAMKLGNSETAIAALIDTNQSDPLIQKKLAEAYHSLGLAKNAYEAAQAAQNLMPTDLDMLIWYARFVLELQTLPNNILQDSKEEILTALKKAIALAPQRGDLIVFLGQMQKQFGDSLGAINTLRKLIQVENGSPIIESAPADLFQAAKALIKLDDPANAVICLEKALQTSSQLEKNITSTINNSVPTSLDLFTTLANAHQKAGDIESALQTIEQALTIDPQDTELIQSKTVLLLKQDDYLQNPQGEKNNNRLRAVKWLEDALIKSPDDVHLLLFASLLQRSLGNLSISMAYIQRVVETFCDPSHSHRNNIPIDRSLPTVYLDERYAYSLAGDVARAILNPSQANHFLDETLTSQPAINISSQVSQKEIKNGSTVVEYYCQHAELALENGKDTIATKDLNEIIDMAPRYPRILALQSRIDCRRGDYPTAIKIFKTALELIDGTLIQSVHSEHPSTLSEHLDYYSTISVWRAMAAAALELAEWDSASNIYKQIALATPLEAQSHTEVARNAVIQAEYQRLCQDIEITRHSPGVKTFSKETYDNFKYAINNALHITESNPSIDTSEPANLIAKWRARGEAVFQPSQENAQRLAALPPDPEDVAAHIACLRELGNLAEASISARRFPQHPLVLIQLALTIAREKPRQAFVAARTAVEALRTTKDVNQIDLSSQTKIRVPVYIPLIYALPAHLISKVGYRGDDIQMALKAIQQALAFWPDEPRWHALAGEMYLYADEEAGLPNPKEAVQHLEQALTLDPNNEKHYLALANLYQKQKSIHKTINLLEKASRISPSNIDIWQQLAKTYRESGNLTEAIKSVDRAIILNPDAISPIILRSEIALQKNDFEEAKNYAQKILDAHPDHTLALLIYVQALNGLGKPSEALQILEGALTHSVDTLPIQIERARLISHTKGHESAIQELNKLVESHPDQVSPLILLAQILEDAGKINEAAQIAHRVLRIGRNQGDNQLNPDYYGIHFLIGRWAHQNGQLDQAIQHLNEAIRIAPSKIEPYIELGHVYLERRLHGMALKIFQQAITTSPEDPQGYFQAGLVLKDSKDYSGSEQMLRQAAKFAPNDLAIQRYLGAVVALNLVHNPISKMQESMLKSL